MGLAAVIFPGQGSQVVGMGKDVVDSSSAARTVFRRANEVVGFDLAKLCFEGPAEKLGQTDIQQPAIFVTSIAICEAFVESGSSLGQFHRAGGLSLGEYTALCVSGAVAFDDALKLVCRRGQLMQEAALAAPSGMVSLIGADDESAAKLCDRARGTDVLAPANFNCPGQIVISGSRAACDRAVALASEFGCRAVALAVAGAFHSPLMESAAEGLWPVLGDTVFQEGVWPVIANVDADYHSGPSAIRESLRRQVTKPVLWQRCIERMIADGVDRFVEVGPGRVLTAMMRKIDRKMTAVNVSSTDSISAAVSTVVAG